MAVSLRTARHPFKASVLQGQETTSCVYCGFPKSFQARHGTLDTEWCTCGHASSDHWEGTQRYCEVEGCACRWIDLGDECGRIQDLVGTSFLDMEDQDEVHPPLPVEEVEAVLRTPVDEHEPADPCSNHLEVPVTPEEDEEWADLGKVSPEQVERIRSGIPLVGFPLSDEEDEELKVKLTGAQERLKALVEVRLEGMNTEGKSLVDGQRMEEHGDPVVNLEAIARIWSDILGTEVTALQVALCMLGFKVIRSARNPLHWDNYADLEGYADIARRCARSDPD